MKLNRNRARIGKCRLQFGIRTLLLLVSIVGPALGLFGPAAVDKLREFFADQQAASQVPSSQTQQLLIRIKLRDQARRLRAAQFQQKLKEIRSGRTTLPSKAERIELGMRADLWEREHPREK